MPPRARALHLILEHLDVELVAGTADRAPGWTLPVRWIGGPAHSDTPPRWPRDHVYSAAGFGGRSRVSSSPHSWRRLDGTASGEHRTNENGDGDEFESHSVFKPPCRRSFSASVSAHSVLSPRGW